MKPASQLFLLLAAAVAMSGCSLLRGDPPADDPVEGPVPAVIDPALERREILRPEVDTEDWEIGAFLGVLSVEDFGTDAVYGLRLAYHATEDIFLEGRYASSTVSDTSFRRLGAPVFEAEEEDLTAYDLSVGIMVLPGEVFLGKSWARTSGVYMSFGVGRVEFADLDSISYAFGFGLEVVPTDWLSLRLEARDNVFESDLLGENEWKHNFEINLGFGVFF
jgi:outer membrane beta-barrel protein